MTLYALYACPDKGRGLKKSEIGVSTHPPDLCPDSRDTQRPTNANLKSQISVPCSVFFVLKMNTECRTRIIDL